MWLMGRQGPSLSSLSWRGRREVRGVRREEASEETKLGCPGKGQAWGTHNPKLKPKTQNETVSV